MPDITPQVEKILKTTKVIPLHTHNGTDSLKVSYKDLADLPSSSAATKTYFGNVNADGTASFLPSGWTSVWNPGTTNYTITHNLGTTKFAFSATSGFQNGGTFTVSSGKTINTFLVTIEDNAVGGSHNAIQIDWDFILVTST